MDTISAAEFKTNILRMILLIYQRRQNGKGEFDFYKIVKCQFHLNLPEATSALLQKLCSTDEQYLIAYQIAFDLIDKE